MNMLHKMMAGSAGLAMLAGAAAPAAAQNYGYPQYGQQYGNQNQGGVVGAIINGVLGGGRYGTYGQGNDRMAVDQCARAAEASVNRDRRYGAYGQGQYGQYGQGQYGQYGQGQYGQGGYPNNDPRYNQGYNYNRSNARVVAITGVERRTSGLKVTGLIDTGRNYRGQGYGNQGYDNQYQGQAYPNQGYDPRYPQQGYDPRYPQQGYNQGIDPRFGGWNSQGYANAARYAELRFNCRVDYRGQITRLNIERNDQFRRDY